MTSVLYKFRTLTRDEKSLYAVLFAVVGVTIVMPIAGMVYFSLAPEFPVQGDYSLTYQNYIDFFSNTEFLYEVTLNTAIFAGGSTIIGLSIGLAAAFFFGKYVESRRLQLLLILPYAVPQPALVTGWLLILGRNGFVNNLLIDIFNLAGPPINLYSLPGMIMVDGLSVAPLAFLLLAPSVASISGEMEEGSLVHGATEFETLRKIILPIMSPAIASVAIFIFARAMTMVTVPSLLGVPNQIFTFGSAIPFYFLGDIRLQYNMALVFGVFIGVISAMIMSLYFLLTKKEEKYTTVSGSGGTEAKNYQLGKKKRYAGYSFFALYIFIAGFLPIFVTFWQSIIPGLDLTLDVSQFTVQYYAELFAGQAQVVPHWWRSFANTTLVGLIAPTIAIIVAFLISYTYKVLNLPLGGGLAFIASAPLAIPAIAMSLGFSVTLAYTPIYGTFFALLIAFAGRGLPIAMRYSSPGIVKLGKENIEAATVSGRYEIATFKDIVAPLLRPEIESGWLHVFIMVIRNVPIAILLYSAGSEVIAVDLLFALMDGYFKTATVMAVILTILCAVPYMFLHHRRMQRSAF